jgi:hypothetical protein
MYYPVKSKKYLNICLGAIERIDIKTPEPGGANDSALHEVNFESMNLG